MKMEFIFDKDKLNKEGYTEEQCLNVIRKHFKKYDKDNSIKETRKGFFEGSDEQDDYSAFSTAISLSHTNWFLKVISEWYWYINEGNGEEKEDCLKSYYEVTEQNA